MADSSKKALVVFYSRSGNTRKAAGLISSALQCTKEEIIDTDGREGVFGFIRSIYHTAIKQKAEIKPLSNDPSDYGMVVIGTPVWGGAPSAAVRTYLSQNAGRFKNVAFFCTAGGPNDAVFREMSSICGKDPAAVLLLTADELNKEPGLEKIRRFADAVKKI